MPTNYQKIVDNLVTAWHSRNFERVAECLAPNFVYRAASFQMDSVEEFRAMAQQIWSATPDEHVEILHVMSSEGRCACEVRTTATHSGELRAGGAILPATGRKIDILSVWLLTFSGEKISAWDEYGSLKQWVEQMGATVTITPASSTA